jgi:hypothetical protein
VTFDQPKPYRARLHRNRQRVRPEQWYLIDLDLRPGEPLLWSKLQLTVLFDRLMTMHGIDPGHRFRQQYELQITTHPEDRDDFWWVPGTEEPWRP